MCFMISANERTSFVGRKLYLDSGIAVADFGDLSCMLLRKWRRWSAQRIGRCRWIGQSAEIWRWPRKLG